MGGTGFASACQRRSTGKASATRNPATRRGECRPACQVCGVNRMISTRRAAEPGGAGSTVSGTRATEAHGRNLAGFEPARRLDRVLVNQVLANRVGLLLRQDLRAWRFEASSV